jgi:RNA polymerase sigma-70 factor (ECF subfamily)
MALQTDDAQVEDTARKRALVDALYRKYSRALRKFLVRHRLSQEEVADIIQETYCRIYQANNIDSIRHPKAFLFRVANNVWLNTEKRRRGSVEDNAVDIENVDVRADELGPYRMLQAEQELAIVQTAFQELTPKCREVFIMNRFENLSYSQIARELNLSISMIEKYVSQALAHMRKRLIEVDNTPDHGELRLLK